MIKKKETNLLQVTCTAIYGQEHDVDPFIYVGSDGASEIYCSQVLSALCGISDKFSEAIVDLSTSATILESSYILFDTEYGAACLERSVNNHGNYIYLLQETKYMSDKTYEKLVDIIGDENDGKDE